MKKQTVIPVFFASDDGYLPFLAVSVRSLIDNASPDYMYRIHVLNMGLTPSLFAPILEMQQENVRILPVNVSAEIAPLAERMHLRDYYTLAIYYRLFIAELFPQYDKALYLDADIAVNGDISELYRVDLGNRILGAVPDDVVNGHKDFRVYAEEGLGIVPRKYFNSGVLLMNLAEFRRQRISGQFSHLLQTYHFETVAPDQDYLNVICRGQVLYLEKGWNKMSLDRDYYGVPKLVHYNMFFKPWLYRNICYQEYFWKYAERTPFCAQLRQMQKDFGRQGRMAHRKANRTLHETARRIAASDCNFNSLLHISEPSGEDFLGETAYEG